MGPGPDPGQDDVAAGPDGGTEEKSVHRGGQPGLRPPVGDRVVEPGLRLAGGRCGLRCALLGLAIADEQLAAGPHADRAAEPDVAGADAGDAVPASRGRIERGAVATPVVLAQPGQPAQLDQLAAGPGHDGINPFPQRGGWQLRPAEPGQLGRGRAGQGRGRPGAEQPGAAGLAGGGPQRVNGGWDAARRQDRDGGRRGHQRGAPGPVAPPPLEQPRHRRLDSFRQFRRYRHQLPDLLLVIHGRSPQGPAGPTAARRPGRGRHGS